MRLSGVAGRKYVRLYGKSQLITVAAVGATLVVVFLLDIGVKRDYNIGFDSDLRIA